MKKHLAVVIAALSPFVLFAADKETSPPTKPGAKAEISVPLKFVPGKPSGDGGASWSALHPFPDKNSKTLMAQAHAGLFDKFPVQEEKGPELFEVYVADGDDLHLAVEIRAKGAVQKLTVVRDKPVPFQVAGTSYRILFPTISVSSASKSTTTHQAMIIVDRQR